MSEEEGLPAWVVQCQPHVTDLVLQESPSLGLVQLLVWWAFVFVFVFVFFGSAFVIKFL